MMLVLLSLFSIDVHGYLEKSSHMRVRLQADFKCSICCTAKAYRTFSKSQLSLTGKGLVYFLSMILIAITLSAGQTLGDKYTIKYIEHVVVAHL